MGAVTDTWMCPMAHAERGRSFTFFIGSPRPTRTLPTSTHAFYRLPSTGRVPLCVAKAWLAATQPSVSLQTLASLSPRCTPYLSRPLTGEWGARSSCYSAFIVRQMEDYGSNDASR